MSSKRNRKLSPRDQWRQGQRAVERTARFYADRGVDLTACEQVQPARSEDSAEVVEA